MARALTANRAFEERGSMMIRTPQYKLIKNDPKNLRRGGGEYELYDLVKDPREEHDLAHDPALPRSLRSCRGNWMPGTTTCPRCRPSQG